MNPLLQTHFETALDHPNGIKKLRELILSLAMQGKLVVQDKNDQSARELLKEIQAEKERLVKEGKIRKTDDLPAVREEEKPFVLPEGWEWVRLGVIGETNIGLTYSPSDVSDKGTPVLRSNNIKNGKLDLNDLLRVRKEIKENLLVQDGDLLICARNGSKALVGKTAKIKDLGEKMAFGAFMAVYRSKLNEFIIIFINSPLFRKLIDEVNTMTINQLTQNNLKSTIIPLPPLAEQKRIVEKVDQLFLLCDELERLQQSRNSKRKELHNSVLTQCIEADSVSSFQTSFQFLTTHFHELYSVKENVKELRKAVLQLAVMGKLVPQDKNDQPARELLKEIQAEKERFVKEGKIRKMDALPPIKDEEKPFVIPEGWEWVRFFDITKVITCGIASTPNYTKSGMPFISAKNVKPFRFLPDNHKYISKNDYLKITANANPEKNDILLTRVGAGIGETAVIDVDLEFAYYVSVTLIKPFLNYLNSTYLATYLNSPNGLRASISNIYGLGASQGNLNVQQVRQFPIPLPPLAEQKRIVEKVDELLALCDRLEEEIEKAESKRGEILEGMVRV